MLGLFRKILTKSVAPQAQPAPPAPVARPATLPPPLPKPVARTPIPVRVPAAAVPKIPLSQPGAQTTPAAPARPVEPPPASGNTVQIALTSIAAGLPEAISHKVPAHPEQFVAIPIEKILPQLAQGQVVLTAAELRECAPDYFSALAGHDDVPIALPLGDIVKQLSPQHFARRYQQRVEVPEEVRPIFTPGANGTPAVKPAVATPQAAPAPVFRAPTVTTTANAPANPAPAAHAPATPHAPAGKISMSAHALASLNAVAPAVAPRPAASASATPAPAATPHLAAPVTIPSTVPRTTPAPAPKKTSLSVPKPTGHLAVPLASVCKEWIQEVRAQLVDVDVENSKIMVPLELLEPAMKSGKVLFDWEEVAAWIQPPLAIPPTKKVGEMSVDLPLRVLAPLFMSQHRLGAQQRVAVDENIPDLFGGGNGPGSMESQIVSTPNAPAPAPSAPTPVIPVRNIAPAQPAIPATPTMHVPTPAPTPKLEMAAPVVFTPPTPVAPTPVISTPVAPAPVAAPVADEISVENIIGNGTGHFSVKEIIANVAKLPGISGAMLAMNDGLLVTSQTPANVKAETVAAFLPQMFGRMNQYTKELALGSLQQLTLGVADGQWHVIKLDVIYFAVLGKHGASLPLNTLAQVAAELSNQSK